VSVASDKLFHTGSTSSSGVYFNPRCGAFIASLSTEEV
jgi:hypothetical protein